MATSTSRYRFEHRLHDWAASLSRSLCGERRAMFVGVRSDGSVRRIYLASPTDRWDADRKATLVAAHPCWLLYVPHDQDGHAYVEWYELDRRLAELWVGGAFTPDDYADVRSQSAHEGWPESWRVLFG